MDAYLHSAAASVFGGHRNGTSIHICNHLAAYVEIPDNADVRYLHDLKALANI